MSSLWSYNTRQEKNNKIETPSPTLNRALSSPKSRVIVLCESFMERISMLTSLLKKCGLGASMTVEAAIFFLHIMSLIEMLRLHGLLCFSLWECGNQLTVYSAIPSEVEEEIPNIAVSYLYVGNRVKTFLGKEYLDNSPIVWGSNGLNYLSAAYDEECVDIGVTYQVKPKITIFPFPYMRMANRYYGRAWTGYDVGQEVVYVYVTTYGEVWHSRADCTYIYIVVQETGRKNIDWLRNANGEKYTVCQLCKDEEAAELVYYTEQGNRYHNSKECSSLTRYIRAIVWQEKMSYRPCGRCVKEECVE